MVDKDQRVLDAALRTVLSGARGTLERQTALVERLEVDLTEARKDLEHQRTLVAVLQAEATRRSPAPEAQQADQQSPAPPVAPVDAPPDTAWSQAGGTRPSPQDAEEMRGPTRMECALAELRTTGLMRPVVARDVALRYSKICDKKQREGARGALVSAVADRKAVRLPDGSFLPTRLLVPDLPEHIAAMVDAVIPPARTPEPETEGAPAA